MIEIIFICITGLVFGSFVTCASYRLPLEIDIVKKPSYCPGCDAKLGLKDLFPLFSWIFSGGKCQHCKNKISIRYPLIEIATAFLFLLVYLQYGLTAQGIILALMAVILLIMIVADLEHYIIPDQIHIILLPLGLIYHYVIGADPIDVAGGFILGMAIGLALHHGYRFLRKKEGLGYGDVKFFAVAGLWLTLLPIVPFLFFAGLLGVIFGLLWRVCGLGEVFPFGPALAAALWLLVTYPEISNIFWNIGIIINNTL